MTPDLAAVVAKQRELDADLLDLATPLDLEALERLLPDDPDADLRELLDNTPPLTASERAWLRDYDPKLYARSYGHAYGPDTFDLDAHDR